MAAAVLETLTIPRASSFPAAAAAACFPPIAGSAVCALSGRRSSVKLPESRGLRIQSARFSGSVSLSASRLVRRVGRIVCEAQETAVVG